MRKLFAFIASIMALAACGPFEPEFADYRPIQQGDPLPEFRVTDLEGFNWTSTYLSHLGKVVAIVFYNTECPDCREEMPVLVKVNRALKDASVQFLGIARESGETETIRMMQEFGITFPLCPQNDRKVFELFAPSRVPRIYITDTTGVVRFIHTDEPLATEEELLQEITDLLPKEEQVLICN